MWMTRVSINHPVFATMVMVALTVLGLFAYNKLGVEPMPDINPPTVSIRVSYPGASPEQVENDISKPVENAVNTVAGVKRLLSVSYEGLSLTWVEFRLDADTTHVTQEIRDKVAQIRAGFPRDAKDPIVERGGSENDQPVGTYVLVGTNKTQRELTLAAEQIAVAAAAPEDPQTDPSTFTGVPAGAAHRLAAIKDSLAKRDYGGLRPQLDDEIVWSLGGGTDADVAIATWQADPASFEAMRAAIDAGCGAEGDKKVACPAGPPQPNMYQLVLEARGDAWKVTSFVKAE